MFDKSSHISIHLDYRLNRVVLKPLNRLMGGEAEFAIAPLNRNSALTTIKHLTLKGNKSIHSLSLYAFLLVFQMQLLLLWRQLFPSYNMEIGLYPLGCQKPFVLNHGGAEDLTGFPLSFAMSLHPDLKYGKHVGSFDLTILDMQIYIYLFKVN